MRVNVSLTEENAERFKTLGGSKWLNRILAKNGKVFVLTDQDRERISKALAERFKTAGEYETAQLMARISAPDA
jgi:5S rRNA maturation endonuclease (ribonuclease M5)